MKYLTIVILIAGIVYLTYIRNFAVEYLKPTKVEKTSNIVVQKVALSSSKDGNTIILDNNGLVWQCSKHIFDENNTEDIAKVNNLENVVEVDAGYSHYLVLKSDGTVWTWGSNEYGELGDGTNNQRNEPIQISNLKNIVKIACGDFHSMAIDRDGNIWAWGDNGCGQLGHGDTISKNTPMYVKEVKDITQVKCGVGHTIALDKNGFVWTWGFNRTGQLGYESVNEINTIPQKIEGLSNIKSIECGAVFSMAVDNKKCVWSWGYNNNGELGAGSLSIDGIARIGVFEQISMISCGIDHSVLVLKNGEMQGWGNNKNGQLGIKMSYQGRDQIMPKPIKIRNINNVMLANANNGITVVIKNDGSLWYLKSQ